MSIFDFFSPKPGFTLDLKQCQFSEPLMDIPKFYEEFCKNAIPPKWDQFETEEEYVQRLPKPLDTKQIHYIQLKPNDVSYNYDITTQLLTFYKHIRFDDNFLNATLTLDSEIKHTGRYEAQNYYGATFSVEKSTTTSWEMKLEVGFLHFEPLLKTDHNDHTFAISVRMERNLARAQADKLNLILGVRLISWKRCKSGGFCIQEPTIDSPKEEYLYSTTIDAKFVSLHLVNSQSKTQFAVYKNISECATGGT